MRRLLLAGGATASPGRGSEARAQGAMPVSVAMTRLKMQLRRLGRVGIRLDFCGLLLKFFNLTLLLTFCHGERAFPRFAAGGTVLAKRCVNAIGYNRNLYRAFIDREDRNR